MGIENIRMIQKGQITGQTASNAFVHLFATLVAYSYKIYKLKIKTFLLNS